MRCYIAIELGEELTANIEQAVDRLRRISPVTRWVRPGFLHLTLEFLGEVADAALPQISAAVGRTVSRRAPLTLTARGSGTFGPMTLPKVLWVALDGDVPDLSALQVDLRGEMAKLGYHAEYDSYQAHITLGRAKKPQGDVALARCAEAIRETTFGVLKVRELVVFASDEEPGGAHYDALSRHPLVGAPSTTRRAP